MFRFNKRSDPAFGAACHGAGHMQSGGGFGPAGQDERFQRREARVVLVDEPFEPGDLILRDAQARTGLLAAVARDAEVGADVEKILLNHQQRLADLRERGRIAERDYRDAERGVGLVDLAVGFDARAVFGDAGAVAKPGQPGVPGLCVDLRESRHGRTIACLGEA